MKKKSLFTFWIIFFLSPFLVGYMSGKLLLRFSFPFFVVVGKQRSVVSAISEVTLLHLAAVGGRLSRSINVTRIFVDLLLFVASAGLKPDRNWSINYPKTTRNSTKQNITQNVSDNAQLRIGRLSTYNSRRHTNTAHLYKYYISSTVLLCRI